MQLDCSRYRHFVELFDMPAEQKDDLLRQVWGIMGSFVDRAFGTAPEQQLRLGGFGNQRGTSAAKQLEGVASDLPSALDSEEPITPPFNDAAECEAAGKKRR